MSKHFIHYMKHGHDIWRRFFQGLIKEGKAIITERFKHGFVVKSTNGINYRISRKGRVVKNEQSH